MYKNLTLFTLYSSATQLARFAICRSLTRVIFITVQSPHHSKITRLNIYSIQAAACTQFATESMMKTTLTLLFLFIVAQKQGLYFMSSVHSDFISL